MVGWLFVGWFGWLVAGLAVRRTEIGCFSMFIPSEVPAVDEWEYFKISPHLEVEMLPQEGADDIFEATIVVSLPLHPPTAPCPRRAKRAPRSTPRTSSRT